jgi:uncharacterized Zn finger protein (UPF0148 family)
MIKYKRICPTCGSDVFHTAIKNRNRAEKRKQNCNSCAQKIAQSGTKNGMFGKKQSNETIEKIREKRKLQTFSKETRDKMSIAAKQRLEEYNHWLGRKHNEESINKMRIAGANRIHDNNWHPSFNVTACKIIDNYGRENGYNFQHAMNGGEYFIKELGYWVDGYDKEKNVVIEYYENAHQYFINEDEIRIKKIKETLNCNIIILKEKK